MADAQWRMRRLTRLESGCLAACLVNSNQRAIHFEPHFLQPGYEGDTLLLGHAMLTGTKELTHLARYDAHLGRRFERALQQIAKLRESREKRAQAAPQSLSHTPTISAEPTAPAPPDAT